MTHTQTTTKTHHYFRAMLTTLAMLAAMLVAGGAALAQTTTFGNSSPIQIVDNGPANPYPSQINVQNLGGNVTDVNLKLTGYSHTYPDDVGVLLVGPQGQKALLMSDAGNDFPVNDASLTLDDEAANPQPDTTAPKVKSTNPQSGATGVSPTANVSAIFSEDMQAPTINGTTFKLFKKGSTTKLAATVSYDGSADTATLDPANSLKRGATYKAVVSTGAKDLAGNALDQNASLSGLQQKAWTFTVSN